MPQLIKNALGQLVETTAAQQAKLLGRPAPATTPMETGVLGATADQAKMAGTPNQQLGALRAAVQGQSTAGAVTGAQTLQQAQQTPVQATDLTKNQRIDSRQAQTLAAIAPKVQELGQQAVNTALKQATGAATPVAGQFKPNVTTLPKAQRKSAETALNALITKVTGSKGEAGTLEVAAVNKALGRTADNQLTLNELVDMFDIPGITIQPKDIAVRELNLVKALGLPGTEEEARYDLAQSLGVSTAALNKMTMQQLTEAVNRAGETQYDTVRELRGQLANPSLGPTQRADIERQLEALGQTQLATSEAQVQNAIKSADLTATVQFRGEAVPIAELLSSEYISNELRNYVDDPTSSESQELRKQFPDLVKWAEKNQTAIRAVKDEIGTRVDDLRARTVANTSTVATTPVGVVPEEIMKVIQPGYGSAAKSLTRSPILNYLNDAKNGDEAANVMKVLQDLPGMTGDSSEALRFVAGLSPKEIRGMRLDQPNTDPGKQKSLNYLRNYYTIQSLSPDSANLADSVAELFGAKDFSEMEQQLDDIEKLEAAGLIPRTLTDDKLRKVFAENSTPEQVLAAAKAFYKQTGLESVKTGKARDLLGLGQTVPNIASKGGRAYELMKPYMADNVFGKGDAKKLAQALSLDEAAEIFPSLPKSSPLRQALLDDSVREHEARYDAVDKKFGINSINNVGSADTSAQQFAELQKLLDSGVSLDALEAEYERRLGNHRDNPVVQYAIRERLGRVQSLRDRLNAYQGYKDQWQKSDEATATANKSQEGKSLSESVLNDLATGGKEAMGFIGKVVQDEFTTPDQFREAVESGNLPRNLFPAAAVDSIKSFAKNWQKRGKGTGASAGQGNVALAPENVQLILQLAELLNKPVKKLQVEMPVATSGGIAGL